MRNSVLKLGAYAAQGQALRSPWAAQSGATNAAYDCPSAPPFAKTLEIGSYYIDVHASVIDPNWSCSDFSDQNMCGLPQPCRFLCDRLGFTSALAAPAFAVFASWEFMHTHRSG